MLRGSVFLLLIYMILRDLSDPCLGLQPNNDYASTDLAVRQEINAFSPPKFSLKKSYLRNKRHFGLSRDASVQFVNLTRDVLLITLLLQCNDVSLNPGPPVKLSVENFTRSRDLKIAHLNVRSFKKCRFRKRIINCQFLQFRKRKLQTTMKMTMGHSIELIRYQIQAHWQNNCKVLITKDQSSKMCQHFSIF